MKKLLPTYLPTYLSPSRACLLICMSLLLSYTVQSQNSPLNQAFLNWDVEVGCVETVYDTGSYVVKLTNNGTALVQKILIKK